VNPLWSTSFFRSKKEEESLAYFLSQVPIFSDLGKRDCGQLESLVHCRSYRQNETIFEEGDPGSGMYIIRSGRVQVFTRMSDGSEMELARLDEGDFFGETTLTAPANRTASVRAVEPTELLGLFRADVVEMVKKQPPVACKILMGVTRIISERLQIAGKELMEFRQEKARAAAEDEAS